jgi:NADPH:quinone reductase-like Zn-dependent oxidoreductase
MQIAKAFGAEVTAVCSTRNVDIARSIGADQVIDYTREDYIRQGLRYDVILAVSGSHPNLAYGRALSPKGMSVMARASNAHLLRALFQAMLLEPVISRLGRTRMGSFLCKPTQKDLAFITELLETDKIVPVIDRRYPLVLQQHIPGAPALVVAAPLTNRAEVPPARPVQHRLAGHGPARRGGKRADGLRE